MTEPHLIAETLEIVAYDPKSPFATPQMVAHLDVCSPCRDQVELLRNQRDAFVRARPAKNFVDGVLGPSVRPRRYVRPALVALAMAASVVLAFRWSGQSPAETSIGLKGEQSAFFVWKGTATNRNRVANGDALKHKDTLTFAFTAPTEGFLFIANLDGHGSFSQYYPTEGRRSVPIQKGAHATLPVTVELDDYLGEEAIIAVYSKRPLDRAEIEAALQKNIEIDAVVEKLRIRKVAP